MPVLILQAAVFAVTPQINSTTPTSGSVATQVQINGTGFGTTTGNVTFNGSAASIVSWSDAQIVVTVPMPATTGPVQVTAGGVASNANVYFTVPPPYISSLSPSSGTVGTQVTVSGSGFRPTQSGSSIIFNNRYGTVISWSDTQIVATAPSGIVTGPVYVYVNGLNSNRDALFIMPNPTIAGISPSSGPVGTLIQVNGSGFGATQGSSTISIGNVGAIVSSWSDTQISATVPSAALTGIVKVTVGGVDSNTNIYFTVPLPQVTAISPPSGVGGTQVTVSGSGFLPTRGSSSIIVGGYAATVSSWSDTQIIATVSSYATTGPVKAYVNGLYSNQDVVFTMPNPVITGVSPSSGSVGTTVQVNGSGFGATQGSSTIKFDGYAAAVSSWSDGQITATVPSTTSAGQIQVAIGGISSNSVYFTVPPPDVISVSPSNGAVGTQVTIHGTGFQATQSGGAFLGINGASAAVVSWGDTQVVATVPSNATSGPVTVRAPNGVMSNRDVLFIMPNPVVNNTSPTSGPLGTQVTVNGSGFGATQGSSTIAFSGSAANVISWSDTQIIATVPASATSGYVRVTEGGISSNTNVNFTVGSLTVGLVSPSAGAIGTQVTVTGTGFGSMQGSSTISFNNVAANVSNWSDTQIVATVPTGAATGAVKVVVASSTSNTDRTFIVGPAVVSLSPSSGVSGTHVQINGSGFGATQGSSYVYFGSYSAQIVSWSNTQIVASPPAGARTAGVQVTVSNVHSNNDVVFTMPNPVVNNLLPSVGSAGTEVQVNGSGFGATQGSSVLNFYPGTTASIVSWSDTQITATVPAGAVTGSVVVTVGGVSSNWTVNFTVPSPQVISLSPSSGVVGTQVTVTGSGFRASQGSSSILFNGNYGTVNSWSDTQIVVTVPSFATSGPVKVTVNGVGSNQDIEFTLPNPVVKALSPSGGVTGTQVQVNGAGFGAAQGSSTVSFASGYSGVNATVTGWSDTQILATVPATATTGLVKVTVGGVTSTSNIYFTVPAPQVSSVSPASGQVGTQVTVNGSGFGASQGSSTLSLNGYRESVSSWSDRQIVFTVPSGAATGPVLAMVNGTTSNQDVVFTLPDPMLSGLVPSSGPIGSQVQINGSGFGATQGSSTFSFWGSNTPVSATILSWSDNQIIAVVPASATSGPVQANVGGVASTTSVYFTVSVPQITSISPNIGGGGNPVTIVGSGFQPTQGNNSVEFVNGGYAGIRSWSDTQIVATVPVGTRTGPVRVHVHSGTSNYVNYTVPNLVISSLLPTNGPVGTQVTVTGVAFGASQGSSVLMFNGQPATSILSWSDTQIVAAVPVTATTGPALVTVNNVNSNATVQFSVPAPAITSFSPAGGGPGTQITLNGIYFQAAQRNSTVTINGVAATATSWSDTQIVANVAPGTSSGPLLVTVNGVSSNVIGNFTVHVAGYLSGRLEMTPWSNPPDFTPINLSDPEVIDWVHWGLSNAASVDRRSGANQVGSLTIIGPDAPTQYNAYCFDDFTWSNGNVNPNIADACSGLQLSSAGEGFQLTVPADTTPKTLKLYVGVDGATAKLQATLSDNSTAPYVDSSLVTDGDAAGTYTIDFQAASAGQTLTVTYTLQDFDWGDVTIEAAALTPKHPDVAMTQPAADQTFTSLAAFTASVQASQLGVNIGSVSLFQDGSSLMTLENSPFDFQISGLAAGNYAFTAQATDANGLSQTSQPVPVHVVGTGGELAASVAPSPASVDLTSQGTADWVLIGRFDNIAVDRKADVAPLIGDVSYLDWAYSYDYGDNLVTYTAEDGTQQFGPTTSGVYLPNPGSGFEFTVDAGLVERTVNVYLGTNRARGQLLAYFSDGSAAPYVDSSTDSQDVSNQVYSLRYHAASEGQKLTIRYTLLNNHHYGNVTLQAVTLSGAARTVPIIQSLSDTADYPGTLIWINGNFGTVTGSVTFNGVSAPILTWNASAIEVAVPPGAKSGPVVVTVGYAQSNGIYFTVVDASGTGPAASVAPANVSMLVGDSRAFQAFDNAGGIAGVSNWTSSDISIADFSADPNNPDGPPLLTAKAPGQVTINADTATTQVTVYAGSALPAGVPIWSMPGTTSGGASTFVVQATPSVSSAADLFLVQPSGVVQGLKADGTPVWSGSLGFTPSQISTWPDSSGGLIGFGDHQTMTRLDGQSGKPSWSYRPSDYQSYPDTTAIHPDGTIFMIGNAAGGAHVIAIDGSSGNEKFRVPFLPVPPTPVSGACGSASFSPPYAGDHGLGPISPITIAPDGNAYIAYWVSAGISCTEGQGTRTNNGLSLRILKVGSDGSSSDAEIQAWANSVYSTETSTSTLSYRQDVGITDYSPAPIPYIIRLNEVIPDNRGNLLASWDSNDLSYCEHSTNTYYYPPPGVEYGTGVSTCDNFVAGPPAAVNVAVLNGMSPTSTFVLDGVNYSYRGLVMGQGDTAFVVGGPKDTWSDRVVAFNPNTGATLWNGPGASANRTLLAATADGGVVISDNPSTSSLSHLVRYDSSGTPTADSNLVENYSYSWYGGWNITASNGDIEAIPNASIDIASSLWASLGGSPAQTGSTIQSINKVVRDSVASIAQSDIGSTNWANNNSATCNLFVSDVVKQALVGTGLQAPQVSRFRILPAIPPLTCSSTVFTTQIPALAADWATPSENLHCWNVVPDGPDGALPGDVLATGNRDDGQYPNGPDGTGHVGIVTYPNLQLTQDANAKLVSAATVAPPYWPAGALFASGTITLTSYGFRVFDPSQPNQNQGLKTDSTVRRFTCY